MCTTSCKPVYEIDVSTTKMSLRVAEVRARMLHWVGTKMWFLCKCHQADVYTLIKHFKLVHGLCSAKTLHLKCGQSGCSQVYETFSGFRKHLNTAHNDQCSDPGGGPSTSEDVTLSYLEDLPWAILPSYSVLVSKSLVDSCATTLAELKEEDVDETAINSSVISMEEIVGDVYDLAKESVKKCLSLVEPNKSEVECKIDKCFEKMENPLLWGRLVVRTQKQTLRQGST